MCASGLSFSSSLEISATRICVAFVPVPSRLHVIRTESVIPSTNPSGIMSSLTEFAGRKKSQLLILRGRGVLALITLDLVDLSLLDSVIFGQNFMYIN